MKRTNMLANTVVCIMLPLIMGCSGNTLPDDILNQEGNEGQEKPETPKTEYLSKWEEGYMDIHQISTGKGNAAYLILPDGTTMMVDMGDLGTNYKEGQEIMDYLPNNSKTPAQWVAAYIDNFSKGNAFHKKIDYALMTHYHSDHVGNFDKLSSGSKNGYKLQGITHLAELVDINKVIDRSWPEYYNLTSTGYIGTITEYKKFMDHRNKNSKPNEQFIVGADDQFVLKNKAASYPDFSVRNVCGNLLYWTGEGNGTASVGNAENENFWSCGIRISYGKFDWLSCGDVMTDGQERKIAQVVGETDAVVGNHHAYGDNTMNETFVSEVKATAYIVPAWNTGHPSKQPVNNMLSTSLYQGDRYVFCTGMTEGTKSLLGKTNTDKIKVGHVVIRVYKGGDTWQVFVLDDTATDYKIIYKTDVLNSK